MNNKKLLVGTVLLAVFSVGFLGTLSATYADNNGQKGKDHKTEAKLVGSTLEVHLYDDSKALVRGAKVTGISGNSFSAVTIFGSSTLSWTVNVSGNTEFVRRYEGQSSLAEMSIGDFVSFKGKLLPGVSSLTVQADIVKNWSVQKRNASFSGTVLSVNSSSQSFVLGTSGQGNVEVLVSTSTQILKGSGNGSFSDILVGGKITAKGLWNNLTNRLEAQTVKIQIPEVGKTTVEGKLKAIASTTVPTTLVLTVGSKDYTVNVASDTSILNALWLKISLTNFQVGNNIRVYGAVHSNFTIDATVIRNTSLQ